MAGTLNYNSLPNEPEGAIKPGMHLVEIRKATKELSKKGKVMLTIELMVVEAPQINIFDRFALFSQDNHPESFGQYKLKKLLDAIEFKPEGDFTIQALIHVIEGKRFMAKLDHEEGLNGRKYLGITDIEQGYVSNSNPPASSTPPTPTPAPPADIEEIQAELEKDDDIV